MKINLDTPSEDIRIEVIPLIDVIFCILTFFILAALQVTRQQAISVDLPQAGTGAPQSREMLMVSLNDAGQVYVEQQQIASKEQFYQTVKNYHDSNRKGLMVLNASQAASYNQVVQLLDLMRSIGGDRVALATQPPAASSAGGSNTGVPPTSATPGVTPYPGTTPDPYSPYGVPYPTTPYNPNQPQLPVNPGQQQQPGQPTIPPSSYPVNPNMVPVEPAPTPGVTTPKNGNSTPKR